MTTTSIDEGKLEAFMGQAVTDMAHQRSPARQRDALARGLVDAARREPRPHCHLVRLSVDVTNGATGQIGDCYPTAISKNGSSVGETGGNTLSPAARVLCVLAVVGHTNLACALEESRSSRRIGADACFARASMSVTSERKTRGRRPERQRKPSAWCVNDGGA